MGITYFRNIVRFKVALVSNLLAYHSSSLVRWKKRRWKTWEFAYLRGMFHTRASQLLQMLLWKETRRIIIELKQHYSVCGRQTSSLTWELLGNANSQVSQADLLNQNCRVGGPGCLCFNKLSRQCQCSLKLEKHCPRLVILKVWPPDPQRQHHPGNLWKTIWDFSLTLAGDSGNAPRHFKCSRVTEMAKRSIQNHEFLAKNSQMCIFQSYNWKGPIEISWTYFLSLGFTNKTLQTVHISLPTSGLERWLLNQELWRWDSALCALTSPLGRWTLPFENH